MVAILRPFQDVTHHIIDAETVGGERTNRRCLLLVPLAAATVAIGIVVTDGFAPGIGRPRPGARRISVFGWISSNLIPPTYDDDSIWSTAALRSGNKCPIGIAGADARVGERVVPSSKKYREFADESIDWAKAARSVRERQIFLEMTETCFGPPLAECGEMGVICRTNRPASTAVSSVRLTCAEGG
jgi:hypothetical protein